MIFTGQGLYRICFPIEGWQRLYTDLDPFSLRSSLFCKRAGSRPLHSPCPLSGTASVSIRGPSHSNALWLWRRYREAEEDAGQAPMKREVQELSVRQRRIQETTDPRAEGTVKLGRKSRPERLERGRC